MWITEYEKVAIMASKRPNNSRDTGFYFKKKKSDSASGVNNQPDATPNSSDDVTNESHVTKNCSDRVAKQSLPLPNANTAPSTSLPSTTFQVESSHQFPMQPIPINMERAVFLACQRRM